MTDVRAHAGVRKFSLGRRFHAAALAAAVLVVFSGILLLRSYFPAPHGGGPVALNRDKNGRADTRPPGPGYLKDGKGDGYRYGLSVPPPIAEDRDHAGNGLPTAGEAASRPQKVFGRYEPDRERDLARADENGKPTAGRTGALGAATEETAARPSDVQFDTTVRGGVPQAPEASVPGKPLQKDEVRKITTLPTRSEPVKEKAGAEELPREPAAYKLVADKPDELTGQIVASLKEMNLKYSQFNGEGKGAPTFVEVFLDPKSEAKFKELMEQHKAVRLDIAAERQEFNAFFAVRRRESRPAAGAGGPGQFSAGGRLQAKAPEAETEKKTEGAALDDKEQLEGLKAEVRRCLIVVQPETKPAAPPAEGKN